MQFPPIDGFVGLLDEKGREVGDRQVTHFAWGSARGGWDVRILDDHKFELSRLPPVSYVALHTDAGKLMFSLPMVGRPKRFGELLLGASY
jgi:hypothetical protein